MTTTPAPAPFALATVHVDYPHTPGTLYGCLACESLCHCTDDTAMCLACALLFEHIASGDSAPAPRDADASDWLDECEPYTDPADL